MIGDNQVDTNNKTKPEIQGFATPIEDALTYLPDGTPRLLIDPVVSKEPVPEGKTVYGTEQSNSQPNFSAHFATSPEDENDTDIEVAKYAKAKALRAIGVEPFPTIEVAPGITLGESELSGESTQAMMDSTAPGDIGQALFAGTEKASANTLDALAELSGAPVEYIGKPLTNAVLGAFGAEPMDSAVGDVEFMKNLMSGYKDTVNSVLPVAYTEYVQQPYDNETLGVVIETITQFGVTAVPAAQLVKGMTTLNSFQRGMTWGAIADYAAFNPDDPTFAQSLVDYLEVADPEERNLFLQTSLALIEKYEDDPEIVKRTKMAIEGMAIGALFEVVIAGIRASKNIPFEKITQPVKKFIDDAGAAADVRIADRAAETGVTLTAGVDPSGLIDKALSTAGKLVRKSSGKELIITKPEVDRLAKTAKSEQELSEVIDNVENTNARHLESDGWVKPQIMLGGDKPAFIIKKNGTIVPNWAEIPYQFHISRQGLDEAQHQANATQIMIADVTDLVKRAKSGDKQAKDILAEATWYRSMRTRLRKEYGGLGDVFADILGATSANTNVQTNYENALIVLKKFTNGDYDDALKAYEDRLNAGLKVDAKTLTPMHKSKSNPFKLIGKDSGTLFGMNSPAATRALLDLFREVKAGKAPKTVNFTGNLIGYTNAATVDVWAARYLRRINGDPRIAPVNEKGVGGAHRKDSTMQNPDVGGEFGFGQRVFQAAVDDINASGIVTNYDKSLGKLGADDLQAIIWFEEKALWTKNGWTTKAGEGGSFDYEASLSGSANPGRVKELRTIIGSKNSKPDDIAKARAELEELTAEPTRYTAGISMERPGAVPTNADQAILADEITAPLKNDPTVMAHQANNNIGEFFDSYENDGAGALVEERSLNFEVVTREGFDETNVVKGLVEAGRKYDQDAVFWSKGVEHDAPNARPGIEVYFTEKQNKEFVKKITAILRKRGLDGFSMITDNRQADRVVSQISSDAETAGLTGVRMQYIPEFDPDFDPARAVEIYAEKSDLFYAVMDDLGKMPEISYADRTFYDTKVFKNTDRKGAEWINGGTSYDAFLGR